MDISPWQIWGRTTRLYELFLIRVNAALARHHLTFTEFQTLGALVLAGPPYRANPKQIGRFNLLTSGGLRAFNQAVGHLSYTPAADFSGTDSFTYSIADNQGRTIGTPAHVTIQVAAAQPPQTAPGSSTHTGGSGGGGGGSLDFLLLGVLATRFWRALGRERQ